MKREELIQSAMNLYNNPDTNEALKVALEETYPEIKEDEDEKIRKEIILFLKDASNCKTRVVDSETFAKWAAYLEKQKYEYEVFEPIENTLEYKAGFKAGIESEKQKEQKSNVIIPKFRIGDTICLKGSMAEYTIESIDAECYHGKGWGLPISAENNYELVEQKPTEWSEEDERIRQSIIKDIEFERNFTSATTGKVIGKYNEQINWLKSLRPQHHWKPSEEQMKWLKDIIKTVPMTCRQQLSLESLYNDLKKL